MKRDRAQADFLFFSGSGADDDAAAVASSPALKIRRLDPAMLQQQVQAVEMSDVPAPAPAPAVEVERPGNEERAIVLYRPAEAVDSFLLGPLRPRVESRWIPSLKGPLFCTTSNVISEVEYPAAEDDDESNSLAMVPWVPSHAASSSGMQELEPEAEMMEADESEAASMEVEEEGRIYQQQQQAAMSRLPLYQWPMQQHAVPPPPFLLTPVTSSW